MRVIKSARRIAAGAPVNLRKRPGVAASSSLILMGQSVPIVQALRGACPERGRRVPVVPIVSMIHSFAPFKPFRPIKKFKRSKVQRFNSFNLSYGFTANNLFCASSILTFHRFFSL